MRILPNGKSESHLSANSTGPAGRNPYHDDLLWTLPSDFEHEHHCDGDAATTGAEPDSDAAVMTMPDAITGVAMIILAAVILQAWRNRK